MKSTRTPLRRQAKSAHSRAEKRAVIERMLRDDFCQSDREIAADAGVSPTSVGKIRKRLEIAGEILPRLENGHPVQPCLYEVSILAVRPSPDNETVYDPIRDDDPNFLGLVELVRKNGITDAIIVSRDGYIISGHRRHRAATLLHLPKIPVVIRPDISWRDDPNEFLRLLVDTNGHRVKTTAEAVREGIIQMDGDAWQNVLTYRDEVSRVQADGTEIITLGPRRKRSKITEKLSLRQAIIDVIASRNGMPTGDRKVFYLLLNVPGLLRNDVSRLAYGNNDESYNDVTNMLTRMRLDGSIPFDSITDETRPVIEWNTHRSVGTFVDQDLADLFCGYWRDLQQSQPNRVEILAEKNTVASDLKPIAAKYTIPMTSGRGYSSLPPRKAMVDRFKASGRKKLIVIVVSDFDPEGEDIPHSFGVSLRDDFDIDPDKLVIIKAALTHSQVQAIPDLHEGQFAKKDGARYKAFTEKYGNRCWELEAIPTDLLQGILEETIRRAIDLEAFERELEIQRDEQEQLSENRQQVKAALAGMEHAA